MTRVRIDLFASLDGYAASADPTPENPMGEDWGKLTAAYASTRTFRQSVLGDTSGAGTTGLDLRAGATAQLAALGVASTAVGGCTLEQPELFFSYRRDGVTGRHGGAVWLPA